MKLVTYQTAGAFLAEAQGVLEAREVENSLMLGLCLRMACSSEETEPGPYFATVKQDGKLLVAAVMTPPHNLIINCSGVEHEEAFKLLTRDLLVNGWHVPGVIGRSTTAMAFAEIWERITRMPVTQSTRQRIYELTEVSRMQFPSGSFRAATEDDLTLLTQWTLSFHHEAVPNDPLPDVREATKKRIDQGKIFVWEDGSLVSMAAKSRPTTNGSTVNLVYTPPEYRGKGYATACVASLSQHLLDTGFSFCVLFADLANPISNHIYQKIGYRPVCDYAEWRFTPGE